MKNLIEALFGRPTPKHVKLTVSVGSPTESVFHAETHVPKTASEFLAHNDLAEGETETLAVLTVEMRGFDKETKDELYRLLTFLDERHFVREMKEAERRSIEEAEAMIAQSLEENLPKR